MKYIKRFIIGIVIGFVAFACIMIWGLDSLFEK